MIPLRLTAAALAAGAKFQKKTFGLGTTTLIISNEAMKNLLKMVKCPEESRLLFKGTNETIKSEVKEQKGGFLDMLLGALGASLLGNLKAGKGHNQSGERTMRSVQNF